jgi:hypothetical protein
MHYDEIPELPKLDPQQLYYMDREETAKEFLESNDSIIIYESKEGETRILFDDISQNLYCCLVTSLCQPHYNKLYEFLKLAIEGARLLRKQTKNDHKKVVLISKYFK